MATLIWQHQYVRDGLEPDHLNRWQVNGYALVDKKHMPAYADASFAGCPEDKVPVEIVHVEYTRWATDVAPRPLEYTFSVHMPNVHEANNGAMSPFFASTLAEAEAVAQQKLDHLAACLKGQQLIWRLVYVAEGLEPDKHGRWQMRGIIAVPKELLPHYDWLPDHTDCPSGTVPVDFVHVNYTDYEKTQTGRMPRPLTFTVTMPNIVSRTAGFDMPFYACSLEEVKKLAQDRLDHLATCIS